MSSSAGTQPTIAIVGSGPSGCYAAQFLRKAWRESEIVIFDALPVPYGLVRYGVAADHQGAKAVTRQFDRLFERDGVRFVGNVRVGADLSFDALVEAFDIVVLATGLWADRPLGIPQESRARVLGAGTLLRAINGFPGLASSTELTRPLGRRIVVVGNGNVAMDAVRLLVKETTALDGSDVDDDLLRTLRAVPVERVDVVGRSTASGAKFDIAVLRELLQLSNIAIRVGETAGDEDNAVVELLRSAPAHRAPGETSRRGHVEVNFHFGQSPVALSRRGAATVLQTCGTDDETRVHEYSADSVITAAGFVGGSETPSSAWDVPGVFRAGWLQSGARGTIPEHRRAAADLSRSISAAVRDGSLRTGRPGLAAVWPLIAPRVVEYEDWRRLDEHERRQAPDGRCRSKVTDLDEMVAVATGAVALQPA